MKNHEKSLFLLLENLIKKILFLPKKKTSHHHLCGKNITSPFCGCLNPIKSPLRCDLPGAERLLRRPRTAACAPGAGRSRHHGQRPPPGTNGPMAGVHGISPPEIVVKLDFISIYIYMYYIYICVYSSICLFICVFVVYLLIHL